jgi:hypothetical protein
MAAYTNFLNGALVMRMWRFDGSSEMLGKFAYFDHAKDFAAMMLARDAERGANADNRWFYLAVCESENEAQAFGQKKADAA